MIMKDDIDCDDDFVTLRKHVMNVHKGMPVEYIDLRKIMKENGDEPNDANEGNLRRLSADAARQTDDDLVVKAQLDKND